MTVETEPPESPPQETEEEKEKEKQSKPVFTPDEQTTQMWARLNDQANQRSRAFFEFLTTNDEYSINGTVFKYHPVKRSEQQQLLDLLKEASALDKEEDFMKYSENIKRRACLVIEEMTPERFEEQEYDLMENLTVAWSLKIRGFRDYKQSL